MTKPAKLTIIIAIIAVLAGGVGYTIFAINRSNAERAKNGSRQDSNIQRPNHTSSRSLPVDFPSFVPAPPVGASLIRASSPTKAKTSSGYTVSYRTTASLQSVYDYYLNAVQSNSQLALETNNLADRSAVIVAAPNGKPDSAFTISIKNKDSTTQIDIRVTD